MKLLLHIGTHKTATTSLQHFLTLNREVLRKHGYFYPDGSVSAYTFNNVASDLLYGHLGKVRTFFEETLRDASTAGCHTVIVSAESFYAMTAAFLQVYNRPVPGGDYWAHETRLINTLADICRPFEKTDIICYFRTQDELAGSMYNQAVKSSVGISDDYQTFIQRIASFFDYARHIDIWAGAFGQDHVHIRNFETEKKDIIGGFGASFLGADVMRDCASAAFHSNERLSRDIMEYKRTFNMTSPDRALAYMTMRCLWALAKEFPDKPGYHVYAPASWRRDFLAPFDTGNARIETRWGVKLFPAFSTEGDPTYPGLLPEVEKAIELRLNALRSRIAFRVELFLRRLLRGIMKSVPGASMALLPVRKAHAIFRLKYQGW